MKTIGLVTSVIIVTLLSTIYSGFALSLLWAWFIVPTFGLTALRIPAAIGLAIVVGYLTNQVTTSKKEKESFAETMMKGIVVGILRPSIAIAIGWIVHLWM